MSASEKHAEEVARKLLAGANVHEIVGLAIRGDDGAAMYHFDMANVMREAAAMLQAKGGEGMTEQEKREKVIKGLEYCAASCKGAWDENNGCPYLGDFIELGPNHNGRCVDLLCADALALLKEDEKLMKDYRRWHTNQKNTIKELLKAQEPRLVTEADFENADPYGYLPVWVEDKDDSEIICDCITKYAITEPDEDYHYRFWTSRPTDEQREAVKWE